MFWGHTWRHSRGYPGCQGYNLGSLNRISLYMVLRFSPSLSFFSFVFVPSLPLSSSLPPFLSSSPHALLSSPTRLPISSSSVQGATRWARPPRTIALAPAYLFPPLYSALWENRNLLLFSEYLQSQSQNLIQTYLSGTPKKQICFFFPRKRCFRSTCLIASSLTKVHCTAKGALASHAVLSPLVDFPRGNNCAAHFRSGDSSRSSGPYAPPTFAAASILANQRAPRRCVCGCAVARWPPRVAA